MRQGMLFYIRPALAPNYGSEPFYTNSITDSAFRTVLCRAFFLWQGSVILGKGDE